MTINITALMIGMIATWFLIKQIEALSTERSIWIYSAVLASFPLYYWAFAIYAADYDALMNEILIGLVFIMFTWSAYIKSKSLGLAILAIGFIAHSIYDIAHNSIYNHSVAPTWWAEFCGSADGIIGFYILFECIKNNPKQTTT